MQKIIWADRDAYITNKFVKSISKISGNTGGAASLDIYKLYGLTFTGSIPNQEFTRVLIHFPLDEIRNDITNGKIDINDNSFWCKIKLKDVYGGQPTPTKFTLDLFPLSSSFEEGIGRDVTFYSDRHECNWLSSSYGTSWFITGCNGPCYATGSGDYITSSFLIADTRKSQYFTTGEEDLEIDVTNIISATIAGDLPDQGFRISLNSSHEQDTRSYFVKRFGSRSVFDEYKRPTLVYGFNDSILDDSLNLFAGISGSIFLYNFGIDESKANILSGSTYLTGNNCIAVRLETPISGGIATYTFTGSQFSLGNNNTCPQTGTYQAWINIPDSPIINSLFAVSGTIPFTPIWTTLDNSQTLLTGSTIYLKRSSRGTAQNKYADVITANIQSSIRQDEENVRCEVFIQPDVKFITPVKIPQAVSSAIIPAYYRIRDENNRVIIPFDTGSNSTRISSDTTGLFFDIDPRGFPVGHSYNIDILTIRNGRKTISENVCNYFTITPA